MKLRPLIAINEGRVLGKHDFVTGDTSVFEDHPHGMSVLSVMAGITPGHLLGTAPSASYWLLRSENANSEYLVEEYNWITAAEFADSVGADIINTSLGYFVFNWSFQNHSYADLDGKSTPISMAADMASKKGMLIVVAAGNEGSRTWRHILAPADAALVLAVGAVDASSAYANFSSHGPSYDGRVKPNIAAQGYGAWVQQSVSVYGPASGTSFSTPIISGLAACLWQAFPSLTSQQIKSAIEKSGSQYNSPDSLLGYGLPDFLKAMEILEQEKTKPSAANQSLWAYPNPFHDNLTLQIKGNIEEMARIEIFDRLGRKVYEHSMMCTGKNVFALSLPDLSGLDKGIYIVRCNIAGSRQQIKIVKQ
jgi:serine protease AprX